MKLMSMDIQELSELMKEMGQPAFRAKQVFSWLAKGVKPENMTNLPKPLRERLSAIPFGGCVIYGRYISKKDGTVKYLFTLEDGNIVEGVLMKYKYGNTLCISTQVGCDMGCSFCASTLAGRVRDIEPGEMLSFAAAAEAETDKEPQEERAVTNIVLMGSGEPLANFDNVVKFLRLVTCPDGFGMSPRNISLSTCGVVPMIGRLIKDAPHVTLSVSLHAPTDDIRTRLMPVNKAYPLSMLIPAARAYADETGRRVIFEYAMIDGVNSSDADADALIRLLRGLNCHINLIPLNDVPERQLRGVTRAQAEHFMERLTAGGMSATIRREMGADIEGACGQLRRRVLDTGHLTEVSHVIRIENDDGQTRDE